jgi:dephospho-CoA kinase
MYILGLTGNIAAGKSAVASRLAALGAHVIDADLLAREAVAPGSVGLAAIVRRWGPSILAADGTLDRAALRRIVFADPAERAALDAIVHPEVARRRSQAVAAAEEAGAAIVVCDIPLLFEADLENTVDAVLLVEAPASMRRERLLRDRGLTPKEADDMIAAQMPSELKRGHAEYIIENVGSREELIAQVDALWSELRAKA